MQIKTKIRCYFTATRTAIILRKEQVLTRVWRNWTLRHSQQSRNTVQPAARQSGSPSKDSAQEELKMCIYRKTSTGKFIAAFFLIAKKAEITQTSIN